MPHPWRGYLYLLAFLGLCAYLLMGCATTTPPARAGVLWQPCGHALMRPGSVWETRGSVSGCSKCDCLDGPDTVLNGSEGGEI